MAQHASFLLAALVPHMDTGLCPGYLTSHTALCLRTEEAVEAGSSALGSWIHWGDEHEAPASWLRLAQLQLV